MIFYEAHREEMVGKKRGFLEKHRNVLLLSAFAIAASVAIVRESRAPGRPTQDTSSVSQDVQQLTL
jgi:hypothetical protein